eukprot:11206366-Lingulodinium_polyedra.AAC.1
MVGPSQGTVDLGSRRALHKDLLHRVPEGLREKRVVEHPLDLLDHEAAQRRIGDLDMAARANHSPNDRGENRREIQI